MVTSELRNHYSGITAEGWELWLFMPHFGSSSGSTCNFPAGSFRASPQTNAFEGSPRVSVQLLRLHPCLLLPDGTGWSDAPAEHNRPGGPLSYSDSSLRQVPNPPVRTRESLDTRPAETFGVPAHLLGRWFQRGARLQWPRSPL